MVISPFCPVQLAKQQHLAGYYMAEARGAVTTFSAALKDAVLAATEVAAAVVAVAAAPVPMHSSPASQTSPLPNQ
jgi:hypothetical protein